MAVLISLVLQGCSKEDAGGIDDSVETVNVRFVFSMHRHDKTRSDGENQG